MNPAPSLYSRFKINYTLIYPKKTNCLNRMSVFRIERETIKALNKAEGAG